MTTTRATQDRPRPGTATGLEAALRDVLRAVPIGHLDRRFTALQTWFRGVEKEVRRSGRRVGAAAAETVRIAIWGPRAGGTTRHRTAHRTPRPH